MPSSQLDRIKRAGRDEPRTIPIGRFDASAYLDTFLFCPVCPEAYHGHESFAPRTKRKQKPGLAMGIFLGNLDFASVDTEDDREPPR